MGKVIAFVNEKGGVGKSTTCFNVAWEIARNKRVLIIDMDGQGANISFFCGIEKKGDMKTMYHVVVKDESINNVVKHVYGNLDIIPANIKILDMVSGNADIRWMQNQVELIARKYDYVFIDCCPSPNWNQVLTLAVADHVIIPMEADVTNLESITELAASINEVKRAVNYKLNVLGFVITKTGIMTNLFKKSKEVTEKIAGVLNAKVFDTPLRKAVVVAECVGEKIGITDYKPTSKAADDIRKLVVEIEEEIEEYE